MSHYMSNLLTLSFCCCCSSPVFPAPSLLPEPENGRAEYSVQSIYWGFQCIQVFACCPLVLSSSVGSNLSTVPCVTTQVLQCYLWQLHGTTIWWRWFWWWRGVSLHACGLCHYIYQTLTCMTGSCNGCHAHVRNASKFFTPKTEGR